MSTPEPLSTEERIAGTAYRPELRRLLSGFSNFAMSFSLICILAGGITAFPTALSSGGGAAIGVGWLTGGLFAIFVALYMGQIVSAYPTAGGLYYWSSALGGRGWGWVTAWFNLAGLVFVLASVEAGAFQLFRDWVLGDMFAYHVSSNAWQGGWIWSVGIACLLLSHAWLSSSGLNIARRLTDFSGYLILFVTLALCAALLWFSPASLDLSRLWTFSNYTGTAGGMVWPRHENQALIFILGLLLVTYTITGFDASAHLAEDTVDAGPTARRGIIYSVLFSVIFGYLLTCSFVLALPNVGSGAAAGNNVITYILNTSQMPSWLRYALFIGIVLANYLCGLAGVTSCSRMVFAFARDGGLPLSNKLRRVTEGTPRAAIWSSAALALVCTFYSGAFTVLAAGSAVLLYISYIMPIVSSLMKSSEAWRNRSFNLGMLSVPCALLAICGGAVLTFVGFQPPNQAVGYLIGGMLLAMGVAWFGFVRQEFQGPPQT